MICPLMTAAYLVNKKPTELIEEEAQIRPKDTIACLERDCALWSEHSGRCSFRIKV